MPDKKTLIKGLLFAAYFIVVFFLFLLLLFPFNQVKSKLESEVRQRTQLEMKISRISPRFFNRFLLDGVVVSDSKGKVLFESNRVKTVVSLIGLVRGMFSAELNAAAYGGELLVKGQQGKSLTSLRIDANNLDIGSYSLLKELGLRMTGKLGGNFELSNDLGKGRLWIKGMTVRELKIKGFPLPDLDFDQCWLEAELKGDRLTVKKLEFEGKELKIKIMGDLVLRERGSLNLTVKLKPSERLAQEQSGILSLIRSKDAEGFYQFSLGGVLSDPQARLM